jgi:uncharacterized protein YjbI with pentapeptide repeats
MANKMHLGILKQGVEIWNLWREGNPSIVPDLHNADLRDLDIRGIDLRGAYLEAVSLYRTRLDHANLSNANMKNASIERVNMRFCDMSGTNLSEAFIVDTILDECIMNKTNAPQLHFGGINARKTSIFDSSFYGCFWLDADFRNSTICNTDLTDINFLQSNLTDADLTDSDIKYSTFTNTIIKGTIFNRTHIGWTNFCNMDLSNAKNFSKAIYDGPSSIGIDTITNSHGNIPKTFLRGAGLSPEAIDIVHSLGKNKSNFYSAFISHSALDKQFASKLYKDLQRQGISCWFAPEDFKIGDKIRPTLYKSIHEQDKVIIVLSSNSIHSAWVEEEITAALEKERSTNNTVLLPIMLDEDVMLTDQAWAANIRSSRHIGDFTKWKNTAVYKKALAVLIDALKV